MAKHIRIGSGLFSNERFYIVDFTHIRALSDLSPFSLFPVTLTECGIAPEFGRMCPSMKL